MENNFDGILKEYLEFVLYEFDMQYVEIIESVIYNKLKKYLISDEHNTIKHTDTQEKILNYINTNLILLSSILRYRNIEITYTYFDDFYKNRVRILKTSQILN
jgi:hypothetical protein